MATVKLSATYIGTIGDTGIYRVDLSQSGLASIGAISIYDDKAISGGGGAASTTRIVPSADSPPDLRKNLHEVSVRFDRTVELPERK